MITRIRHQLTLLNWLPADLDQLKNVERIFSQKLGCVTSLNDVTAFQASQERKSFLLWPSTNEKSLFKIQKVVPVLQSPKDCSLFCYIVAF